MADLVYNLCDQEFKKVLFLKVTDDTHHADKEQNNIEPRVFNDVLNVQKICSKERGNAGKRERNPELPVKQCAADNHEKNAAGEDLLAGETNLGETKSRTGDDRGVNERNFQFLHDSPNVSITAHFLLNLKRSVNANY